MFKFNSENFLLILCSCFFILTISLQLYESHLFSQKINSFNAKDLYFTVRDGKILCERLRKLEEKVYTTDMSHVSRCNFEKLVIPE